MTQGGAGPYSQPQPPKKDMSAQPLEEKAVGTNGAAAEESTEEKPFSWIQPHPIFVIILVGPDEKPFGIQKDFLCHRSEFYRNYFDNENTLEAVEHIVRLPEASVEVFGLAQNFLFTGKVVAEENSMPSYESLIGLWNLGHKLGVDGLCDQTLEVMVECRRVTGRIPATPLLIQVWRDTPEGSSIRVLLLSWAAEYMRSSDSRTEFAKSLPQEVLSELVVTMSSFDTISAAYPAAAAAVAAATVAASAGSNTLSPRRPGEAIAVSHGPAGSHVARKNVHYLEKPTDDEALGLALAKRNRRSSGDPAAGRRTYRKPGTASSSPPKAQKKRSSAAHLEGRVFSTQQKLDFCADLLNRMLSGPGFWTRLVGPFKEPVNPSEDGVPDYLDKIKRPMDLGTIKAKMDRKEYLNEEEFLVDVRQIFDNCFTYWKKGDPMWAAGERLKKTFEEKYSHMHKWIAKMGGEEGD